MHRVDEGVHYQRVGMDIVKDKLTRSTVHLFMMHGMLLMPY